jgi:hypothetical protein
MLEKPIREKMTALITRASAIQSPYGIASNSQQMALCNGWLTEALNVIELAVPYPENAYRRKTAHLAKGSSGLVTAVHTIAHIMEALITDIDAGLLGNLESKITANVFDDFLDSAKLYLDQRRQIEAGVIAGVVFEDTVRRIMRDKVSDDKNRPLEDLINDLARRNIITGQQSKQAKVAAHVRTKATHAQWDEFDLNGVSDTIQITRQLLRDHLGG